MSELGSAIDELAVEDLDTVPQAVLALKQGFGRLIRTKTDRGVLALLDTRIQRMAYGKIFLESLPKYRLTQELGDVEKFFGRR